MLAYIDSNSAVQIWTGQPVNGLTHQINVDQLWSDADLNAAGIYRVQEFVVPAGQQLASLDAAYTLQGTVVVQTYPTVPIPAKVTKINSKGATVVIS